MEDVGGTLGQVGGDAVGELVDDRRQVLLGQVDRAGRHVDDLETRLHVDPLGQVVGVAAHEHPHVDAGLGQRRGELTHVHVHATGVAAARLGQRRGVEGEDGDVGHGFVNPKVPGKIPGQPSTGSVASVTPPGMVAASSASIAAFSRRNDS